jgi:hypothetical protein
MADKNGLHAEFSQKRLLLGEDHCHPIGFLGQDPGPAGPPGPELGGDVVQHADPPPVGLPGQPEVESRIVDGDDEVGRALRQSAAHLAPQRQEEGEPRDDLDEPDECQALELNDRQDSGLGHARACQTDHLCVRVQLPQRCCDGSAMQVS